MTSALHSNGLGQTSQERRESLPQSNRKEKWEKVNNNDNTHTHSLYVSCPFLLCTPHAHCPRGTSVPKFCTSCLILLLQTPMAPPLSHHCLVTSRCLSHQPEGFWRTGGDRHRSNLGMQVLIGHGASEEAPAMSSRWQQFPTSRILWAKGPHPTLPAGGMENPKLSPGALGAPKHPAFPSVLLYRNTAYANVQRFTTHSTNPLSVPALGNTQERDLVPSLQMSPSNAGTDT